MGQRTYFTHLWAELSREDPLVKPAYLLYGPEEYLTKKAADRIVELCGPVKPFDFVELSGAEAGLADVAEEIETPPMAAERRLVIVRQAEKLLSKAVRGGKLVREAEHLRGLLARRTGTSVLVLVASPSITLPNMPGGSLLKALSCYGSYPLPERQLVQWVQREARSRGLQMDAGVVSRLVALSGTSLMDLAHDLDKLVAYVGTQVQITRAVVDEVVDACAGSLPRLLDAAATRDVPKALEALDAVLLLPRNAPRVLPALAALFEEILLAVETPREQLATVFPAWRLAEVTGRAQGWSIERVLEALDDLFSAELATKSGAARLDAALTRFVVSLGAPGTERAGGGMLGRR